MKNSYLVVIGAALIGAAAMPALAQQKPGAEAGVVKMSEPGKVAVAATVTATATVEAIDKAQRQITLKRPNGESSTVTAGPEVRNFDQIKIGDTVTVQYVEALSMTLKKNGKELRAMTETTDGARAKAGEKPGGIVGRQVEVTADVIGVDAKTQTIKLRGPKQVVDLKVADPEQFKLIKVGDQIQAVFTEAVALSVDTVPKK